MGSNGPIREVFCGPHIRAEQKTGWLNCGASADPAAKNWLRGLDSNQDNQLQRLACYQLHYPGNAKTFYFTIAGCRQKSSPLEGRGLNGIRWIAHRDCDRLLRCRQFVSLLKLRNIWGDSMRRGVRAV